MAEAEDVETDGKLVSKLFQQEKKESNNNADNGSRGKYHVVKSTTQNQGPKIYPLSKGCKRGRMLVVNFKHFNNINFDTRKGSEVDVDSLEEVFSKLGKLTKINFSYENATN